MNKHRKTRQQKIVSRLRHQLHQKESTLSLSQAVAIPSSSSRSFPQTSLNHSLSVVSSAKAENPQLVVTTTISRDLFKTTLITATIISLELILYFLLERR